ncbi:MAG TPA: hybrid sensor histidine kinase/response regulator [Bradyrhizobium sp.]|nr:hybrid sensor histidine kinase/response regulator [Bradyrhizobium sp.]
MPTAQRNSLILLRWMMAASLALPLALFLFASAMSRVSNSDAADQEIQRTLDVTHEHALKVFETIDRSLGEITEVVRGMSDADIAAREKSLHERLRQVADTLPQVKSIWVFDASGHALVNSLVEPAPDVDFSDRDYFRIHAERDIGTFIGEVLTPRPPYQGARFFSVGRRRSNADGSFAGVIQASVLPEYFENFYARIGREPGSFLALIRTDGAVLAHFPVVDHDVRFEPSGPLGQQMAANPLAGTMTIRSPVDGIERRMRYERLSEYPIYVSAGLETSAIRARWINTMAQHLIFGIPATALLFGLLALAYQRTERLEEEANRRIEAEDALRHGQRLEALGQLTGGVAHDFNNLLTIIRSATDFLRRRELPDERRRRYIDAIAETVERASKLTAQLLAFARRQPLNPEVFNVGTQVDSVVQLIRPLVGARIHIEVRIEDPDCFAIADIGQFETAMINLAVNGRDAMNGEGQLTIGVRKVKHIPALRAQASRSGDFVTVSIQDTGTGISPENLDAIFEPFFTTKEVGKGTGLGLSQAFGFVKQSDGDIEVTSAPGQGATFTIYLPQAMRPVDVKVAASAGTEQTSIGRGYRVLVVEDNDDVGQFSTELLEDLGYSVKRAANANTALSILSENEFAADLVFSDVIMPGMNGVELAGIIRDRFPGLPVVLTSGYSNVLAENAHSGFELIQKPYSVEALSRTLRKAIAEQRAIATKP